MVWMLLSLLAPMLWATSNLIDSRLIHDRARSPAVLLAVTGLFGGLPAVFIAASGGVGRPGWDSISVGLVAGLLGLFSYYPYFRALETLHPASAALMWNLTPILVAVLAFLLLGERLTTIGYIALSLLVASAGTAGFSGQSTRLAQVPGLRWMALASALMAFESVLQKHLFTRVPLRTGIALMSTASGAGSVAILAAAPHVRAMTREIFRLPSGLLVILNEVLNLAAVLAVSVAVSLGSVSLVKGLGGLQPLFVLLGAPVVAQWTRASAVSFPDVPRVRPSIIATCLAVAGLTLVEWK